MDPRRVKSVTVSAGEIAERESFVDLGDVHNGRTDGTHGRLNCVEIQSETWYKAAHGVCPGIAGIAVRSVR